MLYDLPTGGEYDGVEGFDAGGVYDGLEEEPVLYDFPLELDEEDDGLLELELELPVL